MKFEHKICQTGYAGIVLEEYCPRAAVRVALGESPNVPSQEIMYETICEACKNKIGVIKANVKN